MIGLRKRISVVVKRERESLHFFDFIIMILTHNKFNISYIKIFLIYYFVKFSVLVMGLRQFKIYTDAGRFLPPYCL